MELASDAVSAMKGMGKTGDLMVTEAMEGEQAILVFSDAHGSLNISLYGTHYYLYGFEIREGQRGQGFGTSLLIKVLSFLAEREPLPVTLQVSGSGGPALSLYKNRVPHHRNPVPLSVLSFGRPAISLIGRIGLPDGC